jgi:hypothetical protein
VDYPTHIRLLSTPYEGGKYAGWQPIMEEVPWTRKVILSNDRTIFTVDLNFKLDYYNDLEVWVHFLVFVFTIDNLDRDVIDGNLSFENLERIPFVAFRTTHTE